MFGFREHFIFTFFMFCRLGYMRFLMIDKCISKKTDSEEPASKDSQKEKSSDTCKNTSDENLVVVKL